MEIYVSNICLSAAVPDLKRALACVLHSHHFEKYSALPLNFDISLLPSSTNGPRSGRLTLPHVEAGRQFLREYGGKRPRERIRVGTAKRSPLFEPSRRDPRPDLVHKLRLLPYVDPLQEEKQTALLAQLRARLVSVSAIQFGWQCRDGVFSIEYEKSCEGIGRLGFDDDRRQLRLCIHESQGNSIVVVRGPQVSSASIAVDPRTNLPVLALTLAYPPIFEIGEHTEVNSDDHYDLFDYRLRRPARGPSRVRISAFDNEHNTCVAFSSLSIRIVCSEHSADNLRWICEHAHIPFRSCLSPAERRGVFSPELQMIYMAWLPTVRYEIAFQIDAIARKTTLSLHELLLLRGEIEATAEANGTPWTAAFLRHFGHQVQDPSWFENISSNNYGEALLELFKSQKSAYILPFSTETQEDTFECYHARITPTRLLLEGPFPERKNRVMRKFDGYTSNFLRVSFVDDDGLQFRFDRDVDGRPLIHDRFGEPLLKGLEIAGRRFDWLAYSQSGLKQHSVWFVTPFIAHEAQGRVREDAETIIAGLGVFHGNAYDPELMRCPARYGARIALAFTATEAAVEVEVEEVLFIEDIWDSAERRSFTDGVGLMSKELAMDIWGALQNKSAQHRRYGRRMPSAIQIRFQGYKGMLSIDHKLQGRAICLRPSMKKFEAPDTMMIEVASIFNRPARFYLNRPLIMLLEGLQVQGGYEIFKTLQDAVIQDTKAATRSYKGAATLCESYGLGSAFKLASIFSNLAKLGVDNLNDTFLRQTLNFGIYHVLRDLKYRARIPVPGGYSLVGVADIHAYLEEDEIFACVDQGDGEEPIYLEGLTMITRSPTIHPGDVQVVRAIGRPPSGSVFAIEPLTNSVVFSVKGSRPLASCLSGGDLDGDVFVCTTMKELLPTVVYQPAEYDVAERRTIDHDSTREDLADFVMEYLYSDNIGIIASAWMVTADQSDEGIEDPDCLELARLHSDAADYPKSGRPVPLLDIPRPKFSGIKPDWKVPEVGEGAGLFYESRRYIGRLFREVRLSVPRVQQPSFQSLEDLPSTSALLASLRTEKFVPDGDIEDAVFGRVSQFIEAQAIPPTSYFHAKEMCALYVDYMQTLRHISASYGLSHRRSSKLTEEELVVGTIVAQTSQPKMRKEAMSQMREQTTFLVNRISTQISGPESEDAKDALTRAWLAYRISALQPTAFGCRSFRLVAMCEVFAAIRTIEIMDRFFGPRL